MVCARIYAWNIGLVDLHGHTRSHNFFVHSHNGVRRKVEVDVLHDPLENACNLPYCIAAKICIYCIEMFQK